MTASSRRRAARDVAPRAGIASFSPQVAPSRVYTDTAWLTSEQRFGDSRWIAVDEAIAPVAQPQAAVPRPALIDDTGLPSVFGRRAGLRWTASVFLPGAHQAHDIRRSNARVLIPTVPPALGWHKAHRSTQ